MKAVLRGEDIIVTVQGGVVRKAAETDGLETGDGDFIPLAEVQKAMVELGERQAKRPAARWTRRRR